MALAFGVLSDSAKAELATYTRVNSWECKHAPGIWVSAYVSDDNSVLTVASERPGGPVVCTWSCGLPGKEEEDLSIRLACIGYLCGAGWAKAGHPRSVWRYAEERHIPPQLMAMWFGEIENGA